ncbi:MAG: signal peptidase II [Myxococcales bacterium]|nr:signal peptidase II [Myxococcales bacterium]
MLRVLSHGAVALVGVLLDQLSKGWAERALFGRPSQTVIDGVFQLRLARNPGAFFSLGAGLDPEPRRMFFVAASALAIGLIAVLFFRAGPTERRLRWALTLLASGAVGNLVDRIRDGRVIDFLHLHAGDFFHWATFNVADILITAGLVLLVLDLWKSTPQPNARGPLEPGLSEAPR